MEKQKLGRVWGMEETEKKARKHVCVFVKNQIRIVIPAGSKTNLGG